MTWRMIVHTPQSQIRLSTRLLYRPSWLFRESTTSGICAMATRSCAIVQINQRRAASRWSCNWVKSSVGSPEASAATSLDAPLDDFGVKQPCEPVEIDRLHRGQDVVHHYRVERLHGR